MLFLMYSSETVDVVENWCVLTMFRSRMKILCSRQDMGRLDTSGRTG